VDPRITEHLFRKRFRFNPLFRAVAIDTLTPDERRDLGDLRNDGDVAFALLPATAAFSAKAVCADTAAFLASLRTPSELSEAARVVFAGDSALLARMVLDAVLEIEDGDVFVSGANAVHLLRLDAATPGADNGPPGVSVEALRYGEALQLADAPALSARLYAYNREPLSPQWTRRIPSAAALQKWLGVDEGSSLRARLDRTWIATPPHPENPAWFHFRAPHYARSHLKLYVCPRAEFFPEALSAAVAAFEEHGLAAFKIGRDLQNALRPDKLVAYANSREQIDGAAGALLRRLRGLPAQIVPFTAAIDEEGLLSWGIDPPRSERVSNWQGTSWRRWITDRLAVALISARAARSASPTQFALQRMAVEGIEVGSWTPTGLPWARQVEG